MTKVKNQSGF